MNPSFVVNRRTSSRTRGNFTPSRRVYCTLFGLVCCTAMLFALAGIALARPAHAEYVSSDPAANARLTKAPTTITIYFSEEVNPEGSAITVYDINNKLVSTAAAQVDHADLKTMTVAMTGDQSEIYVVNWYTVAADDNHHDAGSFRFFVNISPMLKDTLGSQSMSGSSTSSSRTMSSGSSSSSGMPIWLTVLVGMLGLLIGGALTFAFTRRSGPSPSAGG